MEVLGTVGWNPADMREASGEGATTVAGDAVAVIAGFGDDVDATGGAADGCGSAA